MSDRKTQIPLLFGSTPDGTIEVAPGETYVDLSPDQAPRIAVADWIPQGDGTFKAVARIHEKEIKLTEETLRQLGIGVDIKTLRRLILGGFVRGQRVSPRGWTFFLQSYIEHRNLCLADPDFWSPDHPAGHYHRYVKTVYNI